MVIQETGLSYFINFQVNFINSKFWELIILNFFCCLWEISEV